MRCVLVALAVLALAAETYSYPSPQFEDEDSYEDGEEEVEENEVYDPPEFISTDESQVRVKPGELLRLTCQVNNLNDAVLLMWLKDETQLALNNRIINKDYANKMAVREIDGKQGQILTIFSAEESDAGLYKCRIMTIDQPQITFNVKVTDEEVDESEAEGEAKAEASDGDDDDGSGDAGVSRASLATMALTLAIANVVGKVMLP